MKKITKSNINKKSQSIKTYKEEMHRDFYNLKMKPVAFQYLLRFAQEWIDWACDNENARTMTKFYNLKRIHNNTVEGWMKRCPELQEAHDLVLQVIGERREDGGLTKKYDSGIVKFTMPRYDKEWKNLYNWHADLSARISDALGTKPYTIEMYNIPSDDRVPVREIAKIAEEEKK